MTRYADRLLASGERVSLRARQHLLATIVEGRIAWLILIAALVLVVLDTQVTQRAVRDIVGWIGFALLIASLVRLTQIYVGWYNQDYLVTNRRVIKVEGILRKRSADSSLEKINDAVLQQSLLGRMLGYGDLDILTANEQSVDRYRMLSEAQTFKRTMLEEKHRLEQDVFQIPAPPLRAPAAMSPSNGGSMSSAGSMTTTVASGMAPQAATATATSAPAAPPAPAPAPAAPVASEPAVPQMTSRDITRALGDLADLRDRGAISPEDYEAKKQDLLERL